jgi:flagellar hook-associated protein 1
MPSITSTLLLSADALSVFERALQVTQNNVANSSTPGFVQQTQTLIAEPDPQGGNSGGVGAGEVVSARSEYAEQAVWQQTQLLGQANQNVNTLTALQTNFDISGNSGIPYALNSLFQAFSAWGQTPQDVNTQQNVIQQATLTAQAFNDAANGLASVTESTNQQLQQAVDQVNTLVGQLAQYNSQVMRGDHNDSGLDAQIYSTLEQLSSVIPIKVLQPPDGSVTVLMNGQTPLLVGDQQYQISYNLQQAPDATYPNSPPTAHILSSDGRDVTAGVTTGQLGALLNLRNQVLPSYIGSATQAGDLNTMAKQFADRVNTLLESGTQPDGSPGIALFTYASQSGTNPNADDTTAAATMAVNPAITADQLAANSPGPPAQSNGIALELSQLANPEDAADMINGESFTEFYGGMAAQVGNDLSFATNEQQVQQSAVAQAQNLRQQQCGVDLNEEAMKVVQFQRAYEASARLITILDQLTEDTINILPTS